MPLSDPKVRNAKPGEKQFKLSDTDGMYSSSLPTAESAGVSSIAFMARKNSWPLAPFPKYPFSKRGNAGMKPGSCFPAGSILERSKRPGKRQKANKRPTALKLWLVNGMASFPARGLPVMRIPSKRGWRKKFSPISGSVLFLRSPPRNYWRYFPGWNHGERWAWRTG